MRLGKVLLLSPHQDDEVLGCGGLLCMHKNVHIHYFNRHHPAVDDEVYLAENRKLRQILGCSVSFSPYHKVNKLDTFPISVFISEIEGLINLHKPQTLLIPFPSYNQDHRVVYEAAITASRPHDKNYYVRNILVYEQPETVQTSRIGVKFEPNLFMEIGIEAKIRLYQVYKSQQRGHRSADHLRHLAGLRGMQSNLPNAEAYMLLRGELG